MNLAIYLVILVLSLVFIFLGYMLKGSADIFQLVGFGFLFLLGVIIIPGTPGTLDYISGTNITETAGGYITNDISSIYSDFTIGFFLSSASVFGFINVFVTRKGSGGFNDDE